MSHARSARMLLTMVDRFVVYTSLVHIYIFPEADREADPRSRQRGSIIFPEADRGAYSYPKQTVRQVPEADREAYSYPKQTVRQVPEADREADSISPKQTWEQGRFTPHTP